MYHPYFRGKQYELIAIRETAHILAKSHFTPIIEPVKDSTNGLKATLDQLNKNKCKSILIINPKHGDFKYNKEEIIRIFTDFSNSYISPGILLTEDLDLYTLKDMENQVLQSKITLIHNGINTSSELFKYILPKNNYDNLFIEENCGKLYRRNFPNGKRILIRDGFERRTNKNHPHLEYFSDLHITYDEENMQGFGDYLIVGNEFSEAGGPAYSIAIHLTFIDSNNDNAMFMYHFKSIRQNDPTDPGGKFREALDLLIQEINKPETKIYETTAIKEFRSLSDRKHFPGLGYVKKLSMIHHIETLSQYFNKD